MQKKIAENENLTNEKKQLGNMISQSTVEISRLVEEKNSVNKQLVRKSEMLQEKENRIETLTKENKQFEPTICQNKTEIDALYNSIKEQNDKSKRISKRDALSNAGIEEVQS